jgi:hypothetical protein
MAMLHHVEANMPPRAPDQHLLEALLDSWGRNNAIMRNLLRSVPDGWT